MGFYSFVVHSPGEIVLAKQEKILERGMNAFNALVDDVDTFVQQLKDNGAKVLQVYQLDEHEPTQPKGVLLNATQEGLVSGETS